MATEQAPASESPASESPASESPADDDLVYPAAPWPMAGSLWLTLFRLGHDADALRPAGVYGAAFVSYGEPSPLTYSELLVARPTTVEGRGRRVTITDIWVDSPASVAGGRALWAIPKSLCDFDLETSHGVAVTRTRWAASRERRPIAEASFTDVARVAPRLPFKGATWQPELPEGGGEGDAVMRGTARTFAARARWDFAADGPLAFLRPARQLASVRMADFRMSFGG